LKINEKTTRRKENLEALNKVTAANASHTGKQVMLPEMIKKATKSDADKALARMFYANGLSFDLADSQYYKEAIDVVLVMFH